MIKGNSIGRFLWFSNLKYENNYIEGLISFILLILFQDIIKFKETSLKAYEEIMKGKGIFQQFRLLNPYTLSTLLYSEVIIQNPPTATIYILCDRIFKIL